MEINRGLQDNTIRKRFFTIKLDNEIDRQYIKEGKWESLNQVLQVRKWISNFRPESQRTSKDMVWVRLPGLGLEFWSEKILFKICKEIGTPIKLDEATARCEVGYYANVLVEIDFAKTVPNKVWIGTKYGGFLQSISIPVCPKFCHTCKIVSHNIVECRVDKNKKQQASNIQNNMSSATTNIKQQTPKAGKPHIPFDICDRSEVVKSGSNTERRQSSIPSVTNTQVLEEDVVISNIVTPINIVSNSIPDIINSGRFNIINQDEIEQEDDISVNEEIIAEQESPKQSLSTAIPEVESVVKFVDVVSGKVSKKYKSQNKNMGDNIEDQLGILDVPKLLKLAEENSLQNSTVTFVHGSNGKVTNEVVQVTSWANMVEKETVTGNSSSSPSKIKGVKTAPVNNKYNFRKNQNKGGTKNPLNKQ
ncbi:uncharacterized protein LOC113331886 [Papaver somniferum]|uniref:uncharacterized protein LOC113331886 n=1 Tax=Papaver somniferum TaxID=3469 RepID=UPI000E6F4BDF|nr:uncharacterized protein LOC113331886 [Papaver somniferum]